MMEAGVVFNKVYLALRKLEDGKAEEGMDVLYDLHAELAMSMHDVEQSQELIKELGAVGHD